MTAIRLFLVCSVASLFLVAAPGARAQSDGVPMIQGEWSGKLTSVYWDQTTSGPPHPKKKFKSKVNVSIDQKSGAILLNFSFDDDFPVDSEGGTSTLTFNGNVGNYHLGAQTTPGPGVPAVEVSGSSNKKGDKLTLYGVAVSSEFTQEIKVKLKRIAP